MNLHLLFASLAAALSLGTAAQAVPTKVRTGRSTCS